jgi:6-phosphogluconolactonase
MKNLVKRDARVEICRDLADASARGADLFATLASNAINARGAFRVALSGGSTPKALYQRLASDAIKAHIAWNAVHFFWSDERCVAPDDAQSNYRMAYDALLAHVPISQGNVHRMRGEIEPARAAREYSEILVREFTEHLTATRADEVNEISSAPTEDALSTPRFDLILLGMGEDGHTASLFPYSPALDDVTHLVLAPYVEKLNSYRLTFTLRVLNHAACVIFLVAGAEKAAILRTVLEKNADARSLPASLVAPNEHGGEAIWLVDEAAASLLS